ncbi:hypothetical protein D0Z00_001208 [Geotrichum galactomycetum]|uniref:Uncharacterized protein n=1 Tax=Geotrichum galactomycetum TaxID=27317 RepID=A0ACB6V7M0_9ASCO|nr:hypothetical protein D0Z00_001208 [Geotrichum candidum]
MTATTTTLEDAQHALYIANLQRALAASVPDDDIFSASQDSVDGDASDPFIIRQELAKLSRNLSQAQATWPVSSEDTPENFTEVLGEISIKLTEKLSVLPPFPPPAPVPVEEPSVVERERVAAREKEKKALTFDNKMSLQANTQESLSADILSLVTRIKSDAVAFSASLAADKDRLDSAVSAVEKAAEGMGKVGERMGLYRRGSNLMGWWFYGGATLFLVLAVVIGMLIVRLFPKW